MRLLTLKISEYKITLNSYVRIYKFELKNFKKFQQFPVYDRLIKQRVFSKNIFRRQKLRKKAEKTSEPKF